MNRLTGLHTPDRKEFGLIAWLEQTRLCLPLKGVECRFAVRGDLLSVELDQIFHQNNSQPLDCLYSFPLPGGAAVYRCEIHVNGRVIRAKVEEANEARKIVREKKAAGYRTALVEMERENLFTLSLGNLQPGDLVVVRFAYFQTLTRLEDWTSFHIPFCPGVRYIPGAPLLRAPRGKGTKDDTDEVPDASRISPPRIDRLHRDAAYLSVEGVVHRAGINDISSPSHPVLVRDADEFCTVTIADRASVPDSDFVLRWTEVVASELGAVAWRTTEGEESYALVRLRAPADAAADHGYAQDIYFLVDRSGSMEGMKWTKAAQAFREFLKTLGPEDRVWATFFESSYRDLAEEPLPAAQLLADPGVQRLEKLGAGGGTELSPALEHVLGKVREHSASRPASLLLITDGQVGNESAILRRLREFPTLRVHTFGIDTAVNDAFLKQMAAQQRGTAYLVTPNDDIAGTVARLGQRLRRPVLTDLEVNEPWKLPEDGLQDLHAGEFLSVAVKGPASVGDVIISGKANGQRTSFRLAPETSMEPALALLWAKLRIQHHLFNNHKDAAINLAKACNLVCEGAAFVAWDETERVPVGVRDIYQPALGDTAGLYELCWGTPDPHDIAAGTPLRRGGAGVADRLLRKLALPGKVQRHQQTFAAWEEDIRRLFFDAPPLTELMNAIRDWAFAEPKQTGQRLDDLKALIETLQQTPVSRASRWKVLRGWVETHILESAEVRQKALDQMRIMEEALAASNA